MAKVDGRHKNQNPTFDPVTNTKVCTVCKKRKPIVEFASRKAPGAHDRGNCLPCHAEKTKARMRKLDAARRNESYRKTRREYEANRPVSELKRERYKRSAIKSRERHPEKFAAQMLVRKAILSGALVRPQRCEVCNQAGTVRRDGRSVIHAHHSDYTKPLDVKWLCPLCHAKEHMQQGSLANPAEPAGKESINQGEVK